jgi:hypothetical protein
MRFASRARCNALMPLSPCRSATSVRSIRSFSRYFAAPLRKQSLCFLSAHILHCAPMRRLRLCEGCRARGQQYVHWTAMTWQCFLMRWNRGRCCRGIVVLRRRWLCALRGRSRRPPVSTHCVDSAPCWQTHRVRMRHCLAPTLCERTMCAAKSSPMVTVMRLQRLLIRHAVLGASAVHVSRSLRCCTRARTSSWVRWAR